MDMIKPQSATIDCTTYARQLFKSMLGSGQNTQTRGTANVMNDKTSKAGDFLCAAIMLI